ncbi:MAG: RbsD/FucU family protein [Bryobacteraceae bacterium]
MLKNLDPLLSPELLSVLAAMGHGDELAIVDANFPAVTMARRLVRLDGLGATRVLEAVLSVLPLDSYVDSPVTVMQAAGQAKTVPETVREFQQAIDRAEAKSVKVTAIDRFDFYDRSRAAFAIVATGETRLYGNVLLKKGVIRS